jgi:hypothetical protein
MISSHVVELDEIYLADGSSMETEVKKSQSKTFVFYV